MRTISVALALIALAGCAPQEVRTLSTAHESGCYVRPVWELFDWPRGEVAPAGGFLIAIDPDTGQGPTVVVSLDSGHRVNLGNPEEGPVFFAAVGDSTNTCIVRSHLDSCPVARTIYRSIAAQSIPLGFELDDPAEILVFHAPTYYLEYSDGMANRNHWRFYGLGHPLQDLIAESIDKTFACWKQAEQAFNEL